MNKKLIGLFFGLALILQTLFIPQLAFADILGRPGCAGTELDTGIGCISIAGTPEDMVGSLLRWALGVGGGIAFILIVFAGFMVMTASGNPERLKAGQELMTSAISGLLLLIFSVFVLNLIGVDILGLDQFGFGK